MPPPQSEDWSKLLDGDERGEVLWQLTDGYGEESAAGVNVDAGWDRLQAQLSGATVKEAAPRRPRAARRYRWLAIAAAAVGLLVLVNYFSASDSAVERYSNADSAVEMPVTLADASKVMLSSGASIEFVDARDSRKAMLLGSAEFVVADDADKAFVIEGREFEIVVVGTAFDIQEEGTDTYVHVSSGHVRLRGKREADWLDLYAGDRAMVRESLSQNLNQDGASPQTLNVRDVTVRELLQRASQQGLGAVEASEALLDCSVTGDFRGNTIEEIAESLSVLFTARLTVDGGEIRLRGGQCE